MKEEDFRRIIREEMEVIFKRELNLLLGNQYSDSENFLTMLNHADVKIDTVKAFLDSKKYVKSIKKTIKIADIFDSYLSFCQENNYGFNSKSEFIKSFTNLGFRQVRNNIGNVVYMEIL